MISKAKTMAVFMVLAMLAVCVVPLADVQGSDAAVGDGQSYSYTIVYDSSKMATGTDALSVDGMTAIYHPSYDATSITEENDGTDGYGSWGWDLTTGLGPFNSFYAAFDIDHGNAMVARLNPFDLSKTIDGYDLDFTNHRYNIMWVLPTVYWKIGETTVEVPGEGDTTTTVTYPTLTLTNDATAGGVAYAHTINGHVYKYVAYGVYEGYNDTITVDEESKTVLTSQTNKVPTSGISRPNFRTYAHNYEMDENLSSSVANPAYSMIWNFYQWELYKYCAFTMMEDFNAQSIVGNGKVYTPDNSLRYNITGLLDQSGPYAGTTGSIASSENNADSSKIFIENTWGSYSELVDGIVFNYTEIYSSEDPESATTVDIYINSIDTPIDSIDADAEYMDVIELTSRYDENSDALNTTKLSPTVIKTPIKTLNESPAIEPEDPFLPSSGIPLYIITNDARLWGLGDVGGGSTTTGLSDYESLPTTTGSKTVSVGGTSRNSSSDWARYGLSFISSSTALDRVDSAVTARLAFVFDVDPISDKVSVTFGNNPNGAGTIQDESDNIVTSVDVPKGSYVSIDDDVISIGYRTFAAVPSEATAQYTFLFKDENGWSIKDGSQINANTTITAYYDRVINSYTITWSYYDAEGQQTSDTTTVQYGKTPTHAKIPARDNYTFAGWNPKPVPVTGETTYTATYTPIDYRVTWDPTGGTVTPTYSTGNIETAITEYPTPTRDHYTFAGWYTQPENGDAIAESLTLTANVTYYAHWTADTYTVQFDAGDGSSASDETGSQMSPVTLPETTLADKTFAGWYTAATGGKLVGFDGTLYYPSADTTLYAVWSDSAIYTYSLNFNANGGYNAPSATLATQTEDGTYDLKIPNANVQRAGQYFLGWATTNSATEAEYEAGDIVPVEAGTPVTLYAVWSVEKPAGEFDWLFKAIAILTGVGVLIGAVALLMKTWTVKENMIKSIITITVASVIYICVMLPIFGLV